MTNNRPHCFLLQVILNSKVGWHLPSTILEADFTDMYTRLKEKEPRMAERMSQAYRLDKNNIPPVYCLLPVKSDSDSLSLYHQRQELYDELCYAVNEQQEDQYMHEGEILSLSFGSHGKPQVSVVWRPSPRGRELGENVRPFIPRLRFFVVVVFVFEVEIRSRTLIPLFRPGSVHSGSVS